MGEQRPWGNCQREHNQKAGNSEPKAGLAVLSASHLCPSIGRLLVLLPILWDEKNEVFKEEGVGEKGTLFLKLIDVPDNVNTSYMLFCLFF